MTDAQPVFERILDITRDLVIEELGILLAAGDGCLTWRLTVERAWRLLGRVSDADRARQTS